MKIDCISDLHGNYPYLPGGDILIIAGDITGVDESEIYEFFPDWLESQAYKKKVVIAGNHDNYFKHNPDLLKWVADYLCDSGTEFEGIKIWGSPWTCFKGDRSNLDPRFGAFTVDNEVDLKEKFDLIPDDTEILVTHGPPWGILDSVNDYRARKMVEAGSYHLREALGRVKPKCHIFGHIHEHGGRWIRCKNPGQDTICYNVSLVDEDYRYNSDPVRIEID